MQLTTVTLKHDYKASRWTLAQIVQLGSKRLRPFVGAGLGVETQTVRDVREEYSRPLGGDTAPASATTVSELPAEFPDPKPSHDVIAFGEVGVKVSVPRRAFFMVAVKLTHTGQALVRFGLGIELF